ncbi:unnamed protein product [Sphagnum troendelagicum]|uniref:Secreted protein n=1 Tax=Sphagnum troendelagicum TaxID=128251 RepID=A0ABP0TCJ8_9BRYO
MVACSLSVLEMALVVPMCSSYLNGAAYATLSHPHLLSSQFSVRLMLMPANHELGMRSENLAVKFGFDQRG